jgi:ubiquinone/menaquinone biosynthesis C-methylase UbiE
MSQDVPSPVDFRQMSDAVAWENTALAKRPWRTEIFDAFVREIANANPAARRILELGSGPGFLAKHLLVALPEIHCTLLDFSSAMHTLARRRLGALAARVDFVERSFKEPGWDEGLGTFDAVVTNQAVHELRHKRHATTLHARVNAILAPQGSYLVCDHFRGEGGMTDGNLYMTVLEQQRALREAGFSRVEQVVVRGSLVMHRAKA